MIPAFLVAMSMPGLVSTVLASIPAPAPQAGMANLSEGKPYTVTQLVPTRYAFGAMEARYHSNGALTNGLAGSTTNYADGQWQGYYRGVLRSVVIDMGRVNTVEQIQEDFISCPDSSVNFPRKVIYSLSLDGKNWGEVGKVFRPAVVKGTTHIYAISGLDYRARYVKMTFLVDEWVFADQFQVFGRKEVRAGSIAPRITPPVTYPNAYCPPGSPSVAGVRNMVLIYDAYYPPDSAEENTVDELVPYVGYENRDGKITDLMFDGFLFLPYAGRITGPSGASYYDDPAHPMVISDWEYLLDKTFDPVYNLGALNVAVGKVKRTLHKLNYKAKVEIAIPYPTNSATDFGEVNGHPVYMNSIASQDTVVKWYIDRAMKMWREKKYANLKLIGFYWYQENTIFNFTRDTASVTWFAGNYIRSLGKVFNWIPYYQASGFAEYRSLGFDAAVMQPNYMFRNFPKQELGDAADADKKLGLGFELEVDHRALVDDAYRAKYFQYLDYGVTKGYMTGAVHMYYQDGFGGGALYRSCISRDPVVRDIYDQTYKFIKGKYKYGTD